MFTKRETNICKGAAILMMLFHHLFNDYGEYAGHPVDYRPLTGDQTTLLACLCGGCVTVFVFLSGYGLAASFDKRFGGRPKTAGMPQGAAPDGPSLTAFLLRRCWNLLTRYWFIFLLALLAAPLGRTPAQAYGTDLKSALFYFSVDFCGLSHMFGTPTLNPTWWYLSLALGIIVLMPFLMLAVRRFGALPASAAVMAVLGIFTLQTEDSHYLFGLLLGILCYEYDLLGRLMRFCEKGKARNWAVFLGLSLFLTLEVRFRLDFRYYGIVDGVFALGVIAWCALFPRRIPVINCCLEVLGKHSANIFFTHTLLYSYYFLDFYYSFRSPLLILAALAVTSLLLSAAIEKLKDVTGWNRLMDKIGTQLIARLQPAIR